MTDDPTPSEQPEGPRTRRVVIYLSDDAVRILEKLGRRFYPGRPRVASQTVERLLREEDAKEQKGE